MYHKNSSIIKKKKKTIIRQKRIICVRKENFLNLFHLMMAQN